MGIFGFLPVYVLNENERVDIHMRPHFVALFTFLFAVTVGAMWDMIVNALGALVISAPGWWHMKRDERSFIEAWIRKFI